MDRNIGHKNIPRNASDVSMISSKVDILHKDNVKKKHNGKDCLNSHRILFNFYL